MNEQLENSENEFLWKLLANPADPSHSYVYNLQLVVSDHPQSGILRALLVPKGDEQHLRHAAPYFDPRTLYKMASNLDGLAVVTEDQIAFAEDSTYVPRTYVDPMEASFIPPIVDDSETNYFHVEDAEPTVVADQSEPVETPQAYIDNTPEPVQQESPVEDEVYEEITPHDESPAIAQTAVAEGTVDEPVAEPVAEEEKVAETEYPWFIDQQEETPVAADSPAVEEEEEEEQHPWHINEEEKPVAELVGEEEKAEEEQPAEDNLLAKEYEEHLARVTAANANVPYYTFDGEEEQEQGEPIEEEVYDEIVSIEDIGLEQLAILNKAAKSETGADEEVVETATEPEIVAQEDVAEPVEDEDEFDDGHFRKDDELEEALEKEQYEPVQEPVRYEPTPTIAEPVAALAPMAPPAPKVDASERVSRYNDEKMPYSFMWWLDKTRKEHADIYQPYGSGRANTDTPPVAGKETSQPQNVKPVLADELQQQYFENIFNANSIHGLDPLPPQERSAEPAQSKEDKIIERFIQEEPQIKHPSTVKLNSENKAKKSSEDRDELVTETLAKIYTEQMLYHKAIGTYKKLMLKYPEKSLYFAGQIEQLENKIN